MVRFGSGRLIEYCGSPLSNHREIKVSVKIILGSAIAGLACTASGLVAANHLPAPTHKPIQHAHSKPLNTGTRHSTRHRPERPNTPQNNNNYSYFRLVTPYVGLGLGYGGDEIGRFVDSDGELEKVRGGGGFSLDGGLQVGLDPYTSMRMTAGYQISGVSRLNGDSSFDRMRFGLTALRSTHQHEFGVGVTMHTSVGYECDIASVCSGDVEFEPAVGYTLEYALRLGNYFYYPTGRSQFPALSGARLGVRYTGIEYEPETGGEPIDGSTLSGFIGFAF